VIPQPHNWEDQLSLRLGGDYNLMPGFLAIRLGASFETRGVNPAYQGLDFYPAMRIGAHLGGTLRLGAFDVSLAYAHLFQETIEVSREEADFQQVAATSTPLPLGRVVNAGTYEVSWNIVSLGVGARF
jgi:hypothetical protein